MAATATETIGLNLEGNFADEALRAAAAGEKFAGGLDMMSRSASKATASIGKTIGQLATSAGTKSPWAGGGGLGAKPDQWAGGIYKSIGAYKKEQEAAAAAAKAKEKHALASKAQGAAGSVAGGAKMAVGAGLAYAGASSAVGLAQIAMGYRGMAVLQALSFRAQYQFRQLFRGVDSTPVLRAVDRLTQLVNGATPAGKALQGIFTRSFNSLFELVEKAEPYISAFFKGAIIGALKLETQYYRLRTAFLPFTEAISSAIGPTNGMTIAAYGGAAAVTYLGIAALGAAAPFVAMVAAIGKAIEQFQALKREWGEWKEGKQLITDQLREDFGLESQRQRNAKAALPGQDESAGTAAMMAERRRMFIEQHGYAPEEAGKQGKAGQATGKAYADGLVEGLNSGAGDVEGAAGALAGVIDPQVRKTTKTQSPSRQARATGAEYPAGYVLGVKDGAPDVQRAVDDMAPTGPAVGGGTATAAIAASGRRELHLYLHSDGTLPASAKQTVRDEIWTELRAAASQLGVPLELGAT